MRILKARILSLTHSLLSSCKYSLLEALAPQLSKNELNTNWRRSVALPLSLFPGRGEANATSRRRSVRGVSE